MRAQASVLTIARGCAAIALALVLASCATAPPVPDAYSQPPTPGSVLLAAPIAADVEDRILAIDPTHVTDDDVRHTLALGPAPRIIKLHGGIFPTEIIMASFADFLVKMGYPERAVRDPGTGNTSHSPYESSANLAGRIAWFYEHEGVRPMIIGHSQGGMQAVKVLYELAGKFDDRVTAFNPMTNTDEDRATILDPLSGKTRPIIGLVLPYGSAVGAGGAAMLLPNQWSMVSRLYDIPDSVENFTGFALGLDLIALDGPRTRELYAALGTAKVRNVQLPASYSHLYVVNTARLGDEPRSREWINAWTPAITGKDPPGNIFQDNIRWAADVWYSIKLHWTIEAQRFVRARRALGGR